MSRYRFGLLTALILVGVGLAVCLAALTGPSSIYAKATGEPRNSTASSASLESQETPPQPSPLAKTEDPASAADKLGESTVLTENGTAPHPVWAQPHPSITYQIQPPPSESALTELLGALKERLDADAGVPRADSAREPGSASQTAPLPAPQPDNEAGGAIAVPEPIGTVDDLGNHRFEIHFQDDDIRAVLEAISEHAGLNIIVSDAVQGNVTANFVDVDVMEALDAILKSTGFLARQEGSFLYVGTADDFLEMERTLDQIETRVYRPNYTTAAELQDLITPLLSAKVGFVTISSASEVGIAADESNAGGDSYAGDEVLLIRDYAAVLTEIDQIIADVDVKPLQVAIEATILSVKLDDETSMGVSFEFLKNYSDVRLGIGSPLNALPTDLDSGGLELAFLNSNMSEFIEALESVEDTNVIATPRVLVLNKHRAEVQIGKSDGYVSSTITETSTSQNVEFLDTGTILRIRPFISRDGMIRMELHPELSSGEVVEKGDYTVPETEITQVTTNVMVRDGCTVIIGGLIREQLSNATSQIPVLGSLPVVGPLFRSSQEQSTVREEVLILLTPHIVHEPETYEEGAHAACEFHRAHQVMAEKNTPFSRDHLSRQYFRLAQNAWAQGDREQALRYAEISVHFNPGSRAAIDLRSDIWMNEPHGGHTLIAPQALPEPTAAALDEEALPPWVIQGLQGDTTESPRPSVPSGEATSSKNITKPGGWR